MFTIQNRAEKKEKETKKADVSPYNPLLSKEINKKERKEYNMEYLYTSFNFVYKYILYIIAIIANIRGFVKSFKMFTKCLQFTY